MKKALVTGGCGFIGSNLVDKLINEGYEVNVIDNLSADSDQFYFNEKATYYQKDILDYDSVEESMKGCKTVFHLAAESRIGPSIENPSKACSVNFLGTNNVLLAARNLKVDSVVYSTTSACYGLSNKDFQKETDPIDNLNPYSASKYAGEELCRMYYKLWGVNTVCLRYFNVYGERMPNRGQYAPVVGIFLKKKKNNENLLVVGDGLQSRDFIHVQDVVSANIISSKEKKCFGETYNIGTGVTHKIVDIAKFISKNYEHVSPRSGEAKSTRADCDKFKSDTEWSPKVDFFSWIKSQML